MARLAVGEKMLDFTAAGAFGPEEALSSRVGKGKTAIVFLRYYGCTLCQYDIHTYAEHYQEIVGDTGKLFVVLQSTPESIKKQMTRETLPLRSSVTRKENFTKNLKSTRQKIRKSLVVEM